MYCSCFYPQKYLKAVVVMATSGYSEDLQSQQTNTVTIATPTAAAPSSAKAAHYLSEIPPASTSITASDPSAVSKAGQDALCSQAAANQNQNQKAVSLNSATQHYVTSDIQQSAAQKTNGQSSSPQYIIVTVTGERSANEPRLYTHSHSRVCVCSRGFWSFFSITIYYSRLCTFGLYKNKAFTYIECVTVGNGDKTGVSVYFWAIYL